MTTKQSSIPQSDSAKPTRLFSTSKITSRPTMVLAPKTAMHKEGVRT
jgi:hypothetical protein